MVYMHTECKENNRITTSKCFATTEEKRQQQQQQPSQLNIMTYLYEQS